MIHHCRKRERVTEEQRKSMSKKERENKILLLKSINSFWVNELKSIEHELYFQKTGFPLYNKCMYE